MIARRRFLWSLIVLLVALLIELSPAVSNHAYAAGTEGGEIVIEYAKLARGDILALLKTADQDFPKGELVRVLEVYREGVKVENKNGKTCEFLFNCGAEYLGPTPWKRDFPAGAAVTA